MTTQTSDVDRFFGESLTREGALLRAVVRASPMAIISLDMEGRVLVWSAAAERIYGWKAEEVIGHPLPVLPPGQEEAFRSRQALLKGGHSFATSPLKVRRKDGAEIDVSMSAEPIRDEDGRVIGTMAVVTDITERKRLEGVAEQERQRLQALGEATPVGVLVVDAASRRVILANRETGRMLGVARGPDDHLDKYRRGVVYRRADGSTYPIAELPLERALREGENVRAEEVGFELTDGRSFLGLVSASPVHSADGRISAAICIIQDMTPLEEIEKLRGEFLSMVSHELKTPLAAIKGAAATVMGSADPFSATETRELFSIINSQADRLRGMVDNMLQMASIESGALSIAPASTDLGALIREAVASFAKGGGDREIQVPDMHDCPVVQADGVRIKQVLANLLSNAAKFSSPELPVTITVEQQADHAIIHIRDQGRGIPREKLSHLFRKFSRIHEGSDTKLSGSGLGLAISKGIVEAHGGRIWATSAGERQGSTFSFTLPVAVQQPAAHGATHDVDALGRPADASAERTRVLVVDDDMSALRTTQHHLRQAGFQPVLAGDAAEAVSLIERKKPAFVLLALGLLEMNSLDLLRRIRAASNVPVILLTGSEDQDTAVQALGAGADDYVTRPFSPVEFRARVAAALHRRTTSGALDARSPFSLGDMRINFEERRVSVKGRDVHLSATEYKLLCELAAHAGQVMTHDQLLQRVWGQEYSGEPELIRSFIRRLRQKLGDDAHCPRCIITERQVGYRMSRPSMAFEQTARQL